MPTLTLTKGLPASGKTTWAKEQILKSNGKTKRVNKDDLRAMLDGGIWSKDREIEIAKMERAIVLHLLQDGFNVIVDNTHIGGGHINYYRNFAKDSDLVSEFEIKEFDTPIEICFARDEARPNSVGKSVIKRMDRIWKDEKGHVAQYYSPPEYNIDLPDCIIVDLDGTLAHMNGREPFDYTKVSTDVLDPAIFDIINNYSSDSWFDKTYIIIVTGREGTKQCTEDTIAWLSDNNVPHDEYYQRQEGDMRNDAIVKQEIYEKHIKGRYNVKFFLDDRDRVVDMWRKQGLKVLQVADGNF